MNLDQVMSHVPPNARDRNVLRLHVEKLLADSKGALVPSWEGEVVCKGTIPTIHQGKRYHTPVCFRIGQDYPAVPPNVSVVPQETMLPYTKAKGYIITMNGQLTVPYQQSWHANCNLATLVTEMQRLFQIEPPLYAVPAGYRQTHGLRQSRPPYGPVDPNVMSRVQRILEAEVFPSGGYADRVRVEGDIAETIMKYPSLGVLKAATEGGAKVAVLEGTVPTRYKNNVYNIPVQIVVPRLFPQPLKDGIPAPRVTPTPDMRIKPQHRHVDTRGMVYCEYLNQWQMHSVLHEAVAQVIQVFEGDPPVYAVAQPRPQPAAQPARPAQPAAQPAAAAAGNRSAKDALLAKLSGDLKVTELPEDDDSEDKACVVCQTNQKDCLCLPCKHVCLCAECLKQVVGTSMKCPMCRVDLSDAIVNIFN